MNQIRFPSFRLVLGYACCLCVALLQTSCNLFSWKSHQEDACLANAHVCTEPSMMALARDLDTLEGHIDLFGSIVAKQPDVWGQARLTRHREEFEEQMSERLDKFTAGLQGSLARSDQAYFANAFALSAAISGRQAGLFAPRSRVQVNTSTATSAGASVEDPTGPIAVPPAVVEAGAFDAFSNITRNQVPAPNRLGFTTIGAGGIGLEPTIDLDQRARYLNHLHELRRINEGDDTADSPGYAMNLVRIPVSVLPGKKTREGYGAEVTMTLTPHLGEDLLPVTFRNLVINDLVDQISIPLTYVLNDPAYFEFLILPETAKQQIRIAATQPYELKESPPVMPPAPNGVQPKGGPERLPPPKQHGEGIPPTKGEHPLESERDPAVKFMRRVEAQVGPGVLNRLNAALGSGSSASPTSPSQYKAKGERLLSILSSAAPLPPSPSISVTKFRHSQLPFPPSQIPDVYGRKLAELVAKFAGKAFRDDPASNYPCTTETDKAKQPTFVHLPSVQSFLQEELTAGYKFLTTPHTQELWAFCTPKLALAIRSRKTAEIERIRLEFLQSANAIAGLDLTEELTTKTFEVETTMPPTKKKFAKREPTVVSATKLTVAMAWAIIVESALLNEQLIQDMKEAASSADCPCANRAPLPYFLPDPPPEARAAFESYVKCRWPIRVFALDPVVQQQNIADTFSARREMQLAMSLAFVSGQVSARNMMRYARRLEYDMETVALNNTSVGFSHGNNTFGWRFYPRFQTHEIESNATVLFRDLLIGGPSRNALLRQRRLEPGQRECIAIVMMPSFVPYAKLHISSNWFRLTNPKHKELTSADAMRLSKAVKTIQTCSTQVCDTDCYRDGDFERLLRKTAQLEERLPLQTKRVQIPFENTLGGFAMFNTGITDLAPELYGWYGASQVQADKTTTVFLVGNHFSIHQTRVVAGGKKIDPKNTELLSRQVIRVDIPAGAVTHKDGDRQYVDVQIATPYGVTPPLLIPLCADTTSAAAGDFTYTQTRFHVAYQDSPFGIRPSPKGQVPYSPDKLVLKPNVDLPAEAERAQVTLTFGSPYNKTPAILIQVTPGADGSLTLPATAIQPGLFASRFEKVFGHGGTTPPVDVSVATSIQLYDRFGVAVGEAMTASNAVTINWVRVES